MPAIIDHKGRELDILNEFMGYFAHKGYKGASMSDVTIVSRPTLYVYFGNKKELFQAVMENIEILPDLYNKGKFMYEFSKHFDEETQEQMQYELNTLYVKMGELMTDNTSPDARKHA